MKISFIKKIKLFLLYRKTLKANQLELENLFNIRVDNASRMYTVINLEEDNEMNENYNLSRSFLESQFEKTLKDQSTALATYLNSKGLNEMYSFYGVTKLTKYSFLVIYGFSLFKSDTLIEKIYNYLKGSGIIAIIITIFYFIVQYMNSY
jgi:hypothetical protein